MRLRAAAGVAAVLLAAVASAAVTSIGFGAHEGGSSIRSVEVDQRSGPISSRAARGLFRSAGCGACHTMAPAGTHGTVGPNLNLAEPPYGLVVSQIMQGSGGMPGFGRRLTRAQIVVLAKFVYAWTSRP